MEQPSGAPTSSFWLGAKSHEVPRGGFEALGGHQQVLLTLYGATFAKPSSPNVWFYIVKSMFFNEPHLCIKRPVEQAQGANSRSDTD